MSSAIVLLENLWMAGTPFGPASVDIAATMDDVKKCSDVIGIVERRWPSIGKMRFVSSPIHIRLLIFSRDIIAFLAAPDGAGFPTPEQRITTTKPKPVAGIKRGRGNTESSGKGGRKSSNATTTAQGSASPPRYVATLPPMRLRRSLPNGAHSAVPAGGAVGMGVGIGAAAGATGGIDYTAYPTTPANWYGQESPHTDAAGSSGGGNPGGDGAGPGGAFGYGGYGGPGPGSVGAPPGPPGTGPHSAQESFMRSDGPPGAVRGLPMWSTAPPGGAPGSEYQ